MRRTDRARTPAVNKGLRMVRFAPAASAVKTLVAEAGIESEILQRFLARSAGIAAWSLTKRCACQLRARIDELVSADTSSEYATAQTRDVADFHDRNTYFIHTGGYLQTKTEDIFQVDCATRSNP